MKYILKILLLCMSYIFAINAAASNLLMSESDFKSQSYEAFEAQANSDLWKLLNQSTLNPHDIATLLNSGVPANVNYEKGKRLTPLMHIITHRDLPSRLPIIKTLIDHGADPTAMSSSTGYQGLPLYREWVNSSKIDRPLIQALLSKFPEKQLSILIKTYSFPLNFILNSEDKQKINDIMDILIEHGFDLSAPYYKGKNIFTAVNELKKIFDDQLIQKVVGDTWSYPTAKNLEEFIAYLTQKNESIRKERLKIMREENSTLAAFPPGVLEIAEDYLSPSINASSDNTNQAA